MMLSALTYTLYMSQVRIIISTKGKMSLLVVFFTFAQCTHRSLPYSCCTWTTIPSMWLPPYLALVDPSSGRRREPFWQTTQSQRQLPGTWLYHDKKFHTPNLIHYQKLCNLLGNVNVLPPDRQPPVLRDVPRRGVHHVGNEEHPRSDPYHCLRTWHRPHVWSQTPSQPKPRWGPSSFMKVLILMLRQWIRRPPRRKFRLWWSRWSHRWPSSGRRTWWRSPSHSFTLGSISLSGTDSSQLALGLPEGESIFLDGVVYSFNRIMRLTGI